MDQTRNDLRDDFSQIGYLLSDAVGKLNAFKKAVNKTKSAYSRQTFDDLVAQSDTFIRVYSDKQRIIRSLPDSLHEQMELRDELRTFLRIQQSSIAALITGTDWQSPSYDHAVMSQAGRQTGSIYATINDYKRDQHADAFSYERAFLSQLIDTRFKFNKQVCTTSSGMAAFSTILSCVHNQIPSDRVVFIGKSVYFQNKLLLQWLFKKRLIEVDETNTESLLGRIMEEKPAAVFVDTLSNTESIRVCDVPGILSGLRKANADTFLVVDNTGMPVFNQPLGISSPGRTDVKLIMFESLNKYHQFGMDRVTGGIFWGIGKGTEALYDYRVHLGTNLSDASAVSLPTPKRTMLVQRLKRHERNATILARTLSAWVSSHPESPVERIWYPGLPSHPDHDIAARYGFFGSYLTVRYKPFYRSVAYYQRCLGHIMAKAGKRSIPIAAGSSFGLNGTRVYLTAVRNKPALPFIRISAGTETESEITKIAELLVTAISSL